MSLPQPVTSPARRASQPVFTGTDICAAAGLPVNPGTRGPCFDDEVWDFSDVTGLAAYLRPVARRLDFTTILNPAWHVVAKRYAFALMVPGHDAVRHLPGAYRTPRTVPTCVGRHVELVRWLNWLTGRGIVKLSAVTAEDCQRFTAERSHITDTDGRIIGRSIGAHHNAVTAVMGLAQYRELFHPSHRYPADLHPFDGKTATRVVGKNTATENATPVIPEPILHPLLSAALYISSTLAQPIIDLDNQLRAYQHLELKLRRRCDYQQIRTVIGELLAADEPMELLADDKIRGRLQRGLMTADDPLLRVNLTAIARRAGFRHFQWHWLDDLRTDLEQAASQLGLAHRWGRHAAKVPRADGTGDINWIEPMNTRQAWWIGELLEIAGMIVVAGVSGMRRSELLELRPGCRQSTELQPGLTRYRLEGLLVKGQPVGGTRDTWVVTKEVHDAVQAAEMLSVARGETDHLFSNVVFHVKYRMFREWVNGPGQRLGMTPIPVGPVNLRMLRRTLAVALAYRPAGVLAAKVQLKHVSVATVEGYAGRPGGAQARFLADVTAEEQQRNLDIVQREYQRHLHGTPTAGPAAGDLTEFFDQVTHNSSTVDTPANVISSDQQIRAMLAKRAKVLHLGTANYCWFTDPAKALCLKAAGRPTADTPLISMCDSVRCPQATYHPVHRDAWQAAADSHEQFIAALPRNQRTERARLTAELQRAKQILAAIDTTGNGPGS